MKRAPQHELELELLEERTGYGSAADVDVDVAADVVDLTRKVHEARLERIEAVSVRLDVLDRTLDAIELELRRLPRAAEGPDSGGARGRATLARAVTRDSRAPILADSPPRGPR